MRHSHCILTYRRVITMTGTACVTTNYAEIDVQKSGYFERLSTWLFGKDNAFNLGCTLVDISTCGGAVLIPNGQPVPYELFELVIMSPERNNSIFTVLEAKQRWINESYTDTHVKTGFEFHNTNATKHQMINSLIKLVSTEQELKLGCSLMHNKGKTKKTASTVK